MKEKEIVNYANEILEKDQGTILEFMINAGIGAFILGLLSMVAVFFKKNWNGTNGVQQKQIHFDEVTRGDMFELRFSNLEKKVDEISNCISKIQQNQNDMAIKVAEIKASIK